MGLKPGEVVGRSVFEMYYEVPQILEEVRRVLAGEELSSTVEVAGSVFETWYSPLRGEDGKVTGVIGVSTDVTERKALEKQLEHQAFHDPLTDLPNRLLFEDRVEHALARTERNHKRVAVLFMDLDNFKFVNDSLGHETGDRLLVMVARRLQRRIRPQDTIARLGGDEFTLLLEDIEDVSEATRIAERLAGALRAPFDVEGHQLFVSASIGIVLNTTAHKRPGDLLRDADLALYEAKNKGRAQYAVFDPVARYRSAERLKLEGDLRRALKRGEFGVYYQPKVLLKTGMVVGVEALARWDHPERGLVTSAEFIPLAEETGLITSIGPYVLEEACRQAHEWREQYPGDSPLTVSVNLSPRQLRQVNQ